MKIFKSLIGVSCILDAMSLSSRLKFSFIEGLSPATLILMVSDKVLLPLLNVNDAFNSFPAFCEGGIGGVPAVC